MRGYVIIRISRMDTLPHFLRYRATRVEVGYHPKSLKEFYRLKALITLEQVNTSVVEKNLNEPNFHGEANWSSVV